jgi:hypothetical protein
MRIYPHLVPRSRKVGAKPLLPLYPFLAYTGKLYLNLYEQAVSCYPTENSLFIHYIRQYFGAVRDVVVFPEQHSELYELRSVVNVLMLEQVVYLFNIGFFSFLTEYNLCCLDVTTP